MAKAKKRVKRGRVKQKVAKRKVKRYRSAKTGRIVTEQQAEHHPDTTVGESK